MIRYLIIILAAAFLLGGCRSDKTEQGAAGSNLPENQESSIFEKLLKTDHYIIYYSWDFSQEVMERLKKYELVIIHPYRFAMPRSLIREIQNGQDPNDPSDDVLVFAYISIGEDIRTYGLSPAQMLSNPRFQGDGSGPRVDPRADAATYRYGSLGHGPLSNIDTTGKASPGGSGFASYYLDDNDHDGFPDINPSFSCAYVNAGDPAWFTVLNEMTYEKDGFPGIRELLGPESSGGLGFDGLFLDTVDTCAPNYFSSLSQFEWTTPGYQQFIKTLKTAYPDKLILQNRGLFFFNPIVHHFKFTTRQYIDALFFESYRLNSNSYETFTPLYFDDNRYNYTTKIMAEANRPDGFKVLSLGYAEGPGIAHETLLGLSSEGFSDLISDIEFTQNQAGFRHYITDAAIIYLNDFVMNHSMISDSQPPVWTSTYNTSPWPPQEPLPRTGIQEVVQGPRPASVTVRWDVALDYSRPRYTLYYSSIPFDFHSVHPFENAQRQELSPEMGAGYNAWNVEANSYFAAVYPYEAHVHNLSAGQTYYFLIRASDASGNEEANETVLSFTVPQ